MKDILGQYSRLRGKRKFVYGRVGSLELYIYPEDDPSNIYENNVMKLLAELDKNETDYHANCEKARRKLLSLSPSAAKQYKSRGEETAESETRRRQYDLQVNKELFSKVRNIEVEVLRSSAHSIRPNRKPLLIIMGNKAILGLLDKDVQLVSKIFSESNNIDELFEKLAKENVEIDIESFEIEMENPVKQTEINAIASKKSTDQKTKNLLKKIVKELKTYANSQ